MRSGRFVTVWKYVAQSDHCPMGRCSARLRDGACECLVGIMPRGGPFGRAITDHTSYLLVLQHLQLLMVPGTVNALESAPPTNSRAGQRRMSVGGV